MSEKEMCKTKIVEMLQQINDMKFLNRIYVSIKMHLEIEQEKGGSV